MMKFICNVVIQVLNDAQHVILYYFAYKLVFYAKCSSSGAKNCYPKGNKSIIFM